MDETFSNDYTVMDNEDFESEMTLILAARCLDGIVLVGDRKMTRTDASGIHDAYGDKITGEIDGILTAFSGDVGTFQVFVNTLRDYVTTTRDEQIKSFLDNPLMGRRRENFGPGFEQVKLRVSQLQSEFNNRYQKYPYKVLMGVSSQYFASKKSSLYYFEADGRIFPLSEPKAIGSGSSHISYYLKRYWEHDKTTMKDFAQLGDFLIRYVSHDKITLDNAVGLSHDKPYPQIVFIPDDPDFCRPNNNGNPKLDCAPMQKELEQYRTYSEQKIKSLHDQPF
jgi:20S proteasome alpha/beta subunit